MKGVEFTIIWSKARACDVSSDKDEGIKQEGNKGFNDAQEPGNSQQEDKGDKLDTQEQGDSDGLEAVNQATVRRKLTVTIWNSKNHDSEQEDSCDNLEPHEQAHGEQELQEA